MTIVNAPTGRADQLRDLADQLHNGVDLDALAYQLHGIADSTQDLVNQAAGAAAALIEINHLLDLPDTATTGEAMAAIAQLKAGRNGGRA
jgi:hypothetical protein